jgi:small subunit ribosomal protein S2
MADLSIQTLLESGAHFGHQTSRWNPNMRRYILTAKNGIHLINLEETLKCIETARKRLAEIVGTGKGALFVGTKPQAKDTVREAAEACKHFFVNLRWLGGTLTNHTTIRRSLKKVADIEQMEQDGTFKLLPRKEVNSLKKRREKILSFLGGIRDLNGLPGVVIVTDIITEHIAVEEAKRLGVPVIGIVDTNCDPSKVNYPVPANDDSLKTIQLILKAFADTITETPVKIVPKAAADEQIDGKKRIVRKKIIKKIIRKKRLKTEAGGNQDVGTAGTSGASGGAGSAATIATDTKQE